MPRISRDRSRGIDDEGVIRAVARERDLVDDPRDGIYMEMTRVDFRW